MNIEIEIASSFLACLLKTKNQKLETDRVERFRSTLQEILTKHYQNHWFPEQPSRGSGYRCLRVNQKLDPLISKAGIACGFNEVELVNLLPNQFTIWIDPQEVSYRIGEEGSISVLYDGAETGLSDDDKKSQKNPNVNYSPVIDKYPASTRMITGNHLQDNFTSNSKLRSCSSQALLSF